tara:strand:- start:407 stop:667 length:261 start_codon:yes stop_codon:yes gene_type:complete
MIVRIYVWLRLVAEPKYCLLIPTMTEESGFKLQSVQVYCGFGTAGAVRQGIIFANIERKKIATAKIAEYANLFWNLILFFISYQSL